MTEEFRQATPRRVRAPAARRAVLLWLGERVTGIMVDLSDIVGEPHSWFYGTQFTVDELSAAATNLEGRGYLTAVTAWGGHVVRAELTATGTGCVERYNGDPDQMETAMTSGQQFNIGSIANHGGNTAVGATVGTQSATTTITIGQIAADLIGLLQAIHGLGGIPDEAEAEAEEVTADLQAAAAGTTEPTKAIGRAKAFFHSLQRFAQPATQALLTAAGNYAALQLGIPHS